MTTTLALSRLCSKVWSLLSIFDSRQPLELVLSLLNEGAVND
jgi:hypothetical protein